jgi:hypothetical protein
VTSVGPGTYVTVDDVWWQITEPDNDPPGWWVGACVVPGKTEGGTRWCVGDETIWNDNQVVEDEACTVVEADVPDEIWAKIAMHAMGVGDAA